MDYFHNVALLVVYVSVLKAKGRTGTRCQCHGRQQYG